MVGHGSSEWEKETTASLKVSGDMGLQNVDPRGSLSLWLCFLQPIQPLCLGDSTHCMQLSCVDTPSFLSAYTVLESPSCLQSHTHGFLD